MITPPTAYSGMMATIARRKPSGPDRAPTTGGPELEMARTADLTALARPRSWATTTSDVSASAGATGRVRKTPPRKKRGMVTLNVVLTKAGMRTMVATIELAATT